MNDLPQHINTPGKLAKCTLCKKLFYFQAQHRHHNTEIIEIGCACPHCQEWLHLGYLNEDLIKRQAEVNNNRRKRAFKRDYEKFQAEARAILK